MPLWTDKSAVEMMSTTMKTMEANMHRTRIPKRGLSRTSPRSVYS